MNLNLYATLETAAGPAAVADAFAREGWRVRKCGWSAFEAMSEWAELIIESEAPVLVHGVAAPGAFERATAVFRKFGGAYLAECYDDETCVANESWSPE